MHSKYIVIALLASKEDKEIGETVLKSSNLKIILKEAQMTKKENHNRIRSNAAKIINQSCRELTIEKDKPFACA